MGVFIVVLVLVLLGVGIVMFGGEFGFECSLIIKCGIDIVVISGLVWIGIVLGCGVVMSLVFSGCWCFYVVVIVMLVMVWVVYGLIGYLLFNDFSFVCGLM